VDRVENFKKNFMRNTFGKYWKFIRRNNFLVGLCISQRPVPITRSGSRTGYSRRCGHSDMPGRSGKYPSFRAIPG